MEFQRIQEELDGMDSADYTQRLKEELDEMLDGMGSADYTSSTNTSDIDDDGASLFLVSEGFEEKKDKKDKKDRKHMKDMLFLFLLFIHLFYYFFYSDKRVKKVKKALKEKKAKKEKKSTTASSSGDAAIKDTFVFFNFKLPGFFLLGVFPRGFHGCRALRGWHWEER